MRPAGPWFANFAAQRASSIPPAAQRLEDALSQAGYSDAAAWVQTAASGAKVTVPTILYEMEGLYDAAPSNAVPFVLGDVNAQVFELSKATTPGASVDPQFLGLAVQLHFGSGSAEATGWANIGASSNGAAKQSWLALNFLLPPSGTDSFGMGGDWGILSGYLTDPSSIPVSIPPYAPSSPYPPCPFAPGCTPQPPPSPDNGLLLEIVGGVLAAGALVALVVYWRRV